jgi:hypothetical protein
MEAFHQMLDIWKIRNEYHDVNDGEEDERKKLLYSQLIIKSIDTHNLMVCSTCSR